MTLKRASEDDLHLISKIQRVEHDVSTSPQPQVQGKDFSKSVKKKLADSKRTGQACDRCKVRSSMCWRYFGCTRRLWPLQSALSLGLRRWSGCSLLQLSRHHTSRDRPTRREVGANLGMAPLHLPTHLKCNLSSAQHRANDQTLDPQDSLRWPARGMHALRAEQNAMCHHRSHHRAPQGARPRRGHRDGEHISAQSDSRSS
jgi:hypothetical protein